MKLNRKKKMKETAERKTKKALKLRENLHGRLKAAKARMKLNLLSFEEPKHRDDGRSEESRNQGTVTKSAAAPRSRTQSRRRLMTWHGLGGKMMLCLGTCSQVTMAVKKEEAEELDS